jgi:mono/diheme cytochrome c family protein
MEEIRVDGNEKEKDMFGTKRIIIATMTAVSFAIIMLTQSAFGGNVTVKSNYVVFAWNDLGMHCANNEFDKGVILPPYNTLIVQVVKRGDPPTVVTSGLTVQYSIVGNTYTAGKGLFGQFWDNCLKLFGITLKKNTGLNLVDPTIHNGLAGKMVVHGSQFEADGIPATPLNDKGVWNPYQVAIITVKNRAGTVVARTRTTLPVSDEINCAKCHGSTDPLGDILKKHDSLSGTHLSGSGPVLCASCHADPILHTVNQNGATEYLSVAMHKFHSDKGATCYDCHPGDKTQCSRSLAHTNSTGGCTTCHGDMANVANTAMTGGRIPWMSEPKCVTCHQGVAEVDTGTTLYRDAAGHGGLHCSACHNSPHAMIPSREASDNYQANQYQASSKTIGSCGACHSSSKGEGLSDYLEEHGYKNPQKENGCNICHTAINSTDTTNWPHQYQWQNSNVSSGTFGGGTSGGSSGGTTTTDGATLYNNYCSGCHGPLATSAKSGATAAMIQTGISTVSQMSSLSSLTTTQIQAIAAALAGSTSGGGGSSGGTTTTDGATLYGTYCAGCHGPLATSSKSGATASMIQTGISSVSQMSSLSSLTTTQIQAIAAALAGSGGSTGGGGTTTLDGPTLYTTYCSSCHGALATSSIGGASTSTIQSALSSVYQMSSLSNSLTTTQIQAISQALAGVSGGGGGDD